MSAVEKFPVLLSEAEEESSAVPPCFSDEGINVRFFSRGDEGIAENAIGRNERLICFVCLSMALTVPLHPT